MIAGPNWNPDDAWPGEQYLVARLGYWLLYKRLNGDCVWVWNGKES